MAILTVEEFRAFVTTTLSDAAIQILLDAAEELIVGFAGDDATATELIDGGHRRLALQRRASSITSITETPWNSTVVTTLAASDYRLRAEGYVIERLSTGTNPRSYWSGLVTVTFDPDGTDALRKAVQLDLVKLDINLDTNLRSHTIGDFSETFANDSSPDSLRADILARLSGDPFMMVVGG